jgi:hypothetical protein
MEDLFLAEVEELAEATVLEKGHVSADTDQHVRPFLITLYLESQQS